MIHSKFPNSTEFKDYCKEKHLILKESDDGRFLVTYPNRSQLDKYPDIDMNDPFVRACRGLIYQNDPFTLLCGTFPKPNVVDIDSSSSSSKDDEMLLKDVEDLVDGSFIKLYHWNGEWQLSTNRCIDAKKSRYNTFRSFYELFMESKEMVGLNFDDLSKDFVYGFVLCHPENRIVTTYTTPTLYHISTHIQDTMAEVNADIGVPRPKRIKFESKEEFQEARKALKWNQRGYMVKTIGSKGLVQRTIFEGEAYNKVKALRGSTNQIRWRYFELKREDPQTFRKFLLYYPEYNSIGIEFDQLCELIHWLYMSFYVNKTTKFIHPKYWELTTQLHTMYLRNRTPTTIEMVRKMLSNCPLNILVCLLGSGNHSVQDDSSDPSTSSAPSSDPSTSSASSDPSAPSSGDGETAGDENGVEQIS